MTDKDRATLALFEAIVQESPTLNPKSEAALEAYRKELVPLGLRKEYQDGSFRESRAAALIGGWMTPDQVRRQARQA